MMITTMYPAKANSYVYYTQWQIKESEYISINWVKMLFQCQVSTSTSLAMLSNLFKSHFREIEPHGIGA